MVKLDANSFYGVNPDVRFRYEDFGGVVYRRQNDQLHFLRSRLAIELLSLAKTGTVREIAARFGTGSSNERVVQENILKILCHLEELEIIYELET